MPIHIVFLSSLPSLEQINVSKIFWSDWSLYFRMTHNALKFYYCMSGLQMQSFMDNIYHFERKATDLCSSLRLTVEYTGCSHCTYYFWPVSSLHIISVTNHCSPVMNKTITLTQFQWQPSSSRNPTWMRVLLFMTTSIYIHLVKEVMHDSAATANSWQMLIQRTKPLIYSVELW